MKTEEEDGRQERFTAIFLDFFVFQISFFRVAVVSR